MEIYVITTYEYNSYSYDGIIVRRQYFHATMQGALDHVASMGITGELSPTIDVETLLD